MTNVLYANRKPWGTKPQGDSGAPSSRRPAGTGAGPAPSRRRPEPRAGRRPRAPAARPRPAESRLRGGPRGAAAALGRPRCDVTAPRQPGRSRR